MHKAGVKFEVYKIKKQGHKLNLKGVCRCLFDQKICG